MEISIDPQHNLIMAGELKQDIEREWEQQPTKKNLSLL